MNLTSSLSFLVVVVVTAALANGTRNGVRITRTRGYHKRQSAVLENLINVNSTCGPIGATRDITPTSGPNGNIEWLDCGINDGGWNPPYVIIPDLITVDLQSAIQDPDTPFSACRSFIPLFEEYGALYNIPPIMLASLAMQESSCNPNAVGGAGEQGLLQLTPDKCGDAPNGNCKDPNFNIQTGAKFFQSLVEQNHGSVLQSIGGYNGWYPGMTFQAATADAHTSCCRCQQNLDYLHQFLNGWCQNVDPYTSNPPLGKFENLGVCVNG